MNLTRKYIIEGQLTNLSPLMIGTGKGDLVDMEVIRGYGRQPYIPATAMIGVLRHLYQEIFSDEAPYFFGKSYRGDEGEQSHCALDDARPVDVHNVNISVRDGIKIDPKTGIAADGAKYDYEVVDPGAIFFFRCELAVYDDCKEDAGQFVQNILGLLRQGIQIGAKTQSGLGQVQLQDSRVYVFEFPYEGEKWFEYLDDGTKNLTPSDIAPASLQGKQYDWIITADFSLQRSLLIGSYTVDPALPDKVQLRSGEHPVISGTSLKGALRSQAERILCTLNPSGYHGTLIRDLFGYVDPKTKSAQKSRLSVKEVKIDKAREKKQTRIRIDRFTGGVMNGALFEEQPIFHHEERMQIAITLSCPSNAEIGLSLLLLRDLWTGMIAIGGGKNIGRGLLQGHYAEIVDRHSGREDTWFIQKSADGQLQTVEAFRHRAQDFVDDLIAAAREERTQ